MKVLAADGYILCRGLVRTLTLLRDDVCVIAADTIDEVLARLSELADLDLVLLDEGMPGMESCAGLRRTVEMVPEVPVVVTSPNESPAHIVSAIRNGARGYFSLSTKPCILEHALPLILSGEYYVPACALRPGCGHAILAHDGPPPGLRAADDNLTSRQREIIVMLAEGKSNKEIAREINVIEGTVKLHVKGILRKLGVRNRTEAVIAAARNGYLPKGTLGMGMPVSERTAVSVGRAIVRECATAPPAQSGAGRPPGDRVRAPRPRCPGRQQPADRTTAAEGSCSGKASALSTGLNEHDQAATLAPGDAPNAGSLSPTKSRHT